MRESGASEVEPHVARAEQDLVAGLAAFPVTVAAVGERLRFVRSIRRESLEEPSVHRR